MTSLLHAPLLVVKCACHDFVTYGKVSGKCQFCGKKFVVAGSAKPEDTGKCKHDGPCHAPITTLSYPY